MHPKSQPMMTLLSAILACTLGSTPALQADPAPERPNILLIYADDLGWRDTSFMGSRYYETPRLDELAASGTKFTQAYSNAPNCAPSRACLMTGLYTPRHKIFTVGSSERGKSRNRKLIPIPNTTSLEKEFVTIAEVLREAGYATGCIGKWHLGKGEEGGPKAHGFDFAVGNENLGRKGTHFAPYGNPTLPDGPDGEYLTDRLTDEAVRFIEKNREEPFFLFLSHYAVHTPIQAKEEKIRKYEAKTPDGGQNNPTYAAMIESLDEGVGKLLDTLERLELRKKTWVVFFSDNGGHGAITSNAPLRGAKGMLYEGGIRVPLVVSRPGVVKQGSTQDSPVIGIDFFPSLLEMAGVPIPEDLSLDGESFVPLLSGEAGIRERTLYWHFPAYLQAYKKKERTWRTTPVGVIRKGEWKLLEFFEDGHLELYHLGEDPGEERNLAGEKPEIAKELLEQMRSWRERVHAPVPTELNPEYEGGTEAGSR